MKTPKSPLNRPRKFISWKTLWAVAGGGATAVVLYAQWAAAQQVPPGGNGAPISVGISNYYCYDATTGTSGECTGNPNDAYDGSGNYFVEDPQNYDYNSDPASYPNQTFGDEYIPQRQQYLLTNSIYQGQNNEAAAADNFNTTIPALLQQGQDDIAKDCDDAALPAYDTASETFSEASSAYENAAAVYADASAQYQTASESFNSAAGADYIYDQLLGTNLAYADLSAAAGKLAEAEQGMATAQQQLATAQTLYTDASKAGLKCQATLSIVNSNFVYNTAQTGSYLLYAMGQQQEQGAAQKQVEVSKLAQDVRTTYGIQQGNAMALQGLVPSGTALLQSARPDQY